MKQAFVECENGVVYYWHTDIDLKNVTLFFLHGLTADHTMFEKQIGFFEHKYNVIVWDAPAHGKSRPFREFSYKNAAEIMLQILNILQVNSIVLVGQSMGGYMAQYFIARYPEMVKGFVSIDSTSYGDCYSKSDIWWLKQIGWLSKIFTENMLKKSLAKQNAFTKSGQDNMYKMVKNYGKNELCYLMGIGYAGFLEDNCKIGISCSTLLLVGEKDNTGKVKLYNRKWSQKTGYPLVWIPNAAHNANVDNPEKVNNCIEEFLINLN